MLPSGYSGQACPIARSLEVVGERWTLLILRDAFLGVRRFDGFQERLDVSRAVLTRRLAALVEAGLLRRESYQRRPERFEYLPTARALELWPTILGLARWSEPIAPPEREFVHEACGTVLHAVVRCPHCDIDVDAAHAGSRGGPGYPTDESFGPLLAS
jgi:DNA-binding HxlR family transcriptional regulator